MLKIFHPSHKIAGILLSLLTGILLSLSWPGRGFPLLLLVAFIPLMIIEQYLFEHPKEKSSFLILFYAWLAFLVFNFATTWWIWNATKVGMVVGLTMNSFLMAFVFWLFHVTKRVFASRPSSISIIIYWLAYEYALTFWDLNWVWLNMGNAFGNWPELVQWYEFTGSESGSLWVLSVNVLLFHQIKNRKKEIGLRIRNIKWALVSIVAIVPIIISVWMYLKPEPNAPTLAVAVIQPAENPHKNLETPEELIGRINKLDFLMEQGAKKGAKLVIAPEGSWPQTVWLNSGSLRVPLARLYEFSLKHDSVDLIMGMMSAYIYRNKEEITSTARPYNKTGYYYDYYNSALLLTSGLNTSTYHKSILVPGVEKMPFYKHLHFLKPVFYHFGGTIGSMGVMKDPIVFHIQDSTIITAPLICYESVFSSFVRKQVKKQAQFISLITNDGWWGISPGFRQHLAYGRLRAIETRRYIARAAFNGNSAIINTKGDILQKIEYDVTDVINADIKLYKHETFFVKYGDFVGSTAIWSAFFLIVYVASQAFLKHKQKQIKLH